MKKLVAGIGFLVIYLSAQSQQVSVRDLKSGNHEPDTSFIYTLPFSKGKSYLLIQAYQSKMSHKGEYALDFKMKRGTTVCAARAGIVTSLREDSEKGGLKNEMLSEGNYIIIDHGDGSAAYYWHLQKDGALVNIGDTIIQGQAIGKSGNTGYSAFPHLHFEVVQISKGQVPTRFTTRKGIRYLRPGKWYKGI